MINRIQFICERAKGKAVIDLGCVNHSKEQRDTINLHAELNKHCRSLVGVDYDRGGVEEMRREGFTVYHANVCDFDLNMKFDCVVAGELIEHLTNPGLFLECVKRHLLPDGELIITTPNAICLNYFVQNLLNGHEKDNPDHSVMFSPRTIESLLTKHAFQLKQVVFVGEHPGAEPDSISLRLRNLLQWLAAPVRPSLLHHFIAVTKPRINKSDIK